MALAARQQMVLQLKQKQPRVMEQEDQTLTSTDTLSPPENHLKSIIAAYWPVLDFKMSGAPGKTLMFIQKNICSVSTCPVYLNLN